MPSLGTLTRRVGQAVTVVQSRSYPLAVANGARAGNTSGFQLTVTPPLLPVGDVVRVFVRGERSLRSVPGHPGRLTGWTDDVSSLGAVESLQFRLVLFGDPDGTGGVFHPAIDEVRVDFSF